MAGTGLSSVRDVEEVLTGVRSLPDKGAGFFASNPFSTPAGQSSLVTTAQAPGDRNRPRWLFPSLQSWVHANLCISNNVAWKATYAGLGFDIVSDPTTQHLVMLYAGSGSGGNVSPAIGLATSDDGVTWTDYGSNPIFSANGSGGQPDSGSVTFPQLVYFNNKWYMFYIGFPTGGFEVGTPNICLATTPSLATPITFTRKGSQLTPSAFGVGITVMYRPCVFQVGSTWYMFVNAGTAAGLEDVYYATAPSPDGPWTANTTKVIDRTLFASALASDPEVIRFGDWFYLFCWSNNGIQFAYCDVTEFPNTWHQINAALPITGGPQRPVMMQLPTGGWGLYVNYNGTTTIDLFEPSSAIDPANVPPTMIVSSARYYRSQLGTTFGTDVAGAGFATVTPLRLDRYATVTSLLCKVTVGAASSFARLGVYADNGLGLPGNLLLDAGQIDTSTTGVKEITGLTLHLFPGLYWLCFVAQGGGPTVTVVTAGGAVPVSSQAAADLFGNFWGYVKSGVTAALPASWDAPPVVATGTDVPLVVMKLNQ